MINPINIKATPEAFEAMVDWTWSWSNGWNAVIATKEAVKMVIADILTRDPDDLSQKLHFQYKLRR